jgi:hypothetical protein
MFEPLGITVGRRDLVQNAGARVAADSRMGHLGLRRSEGFGAGMPAEFPSSRLVTI